MYHAVCQRYNGPWAIRCCKACGETYPSVNQDMLAWVGVGRCR
jgi:hypothetical protein